MGCEWHPPWCWSATILHGDGSKANSNQPVHCAEANEKRPWASSNLLQKGLGTRRQAPENWKQKNKNFKTKQAPRNWVNIACSCKGFPLHFFLWGESSLPQGRPSCRWDGMIPKKRHSRDQQKTVSIASIVLCFTTKCRFKPNRVCEYSFWSLASKGNSKSKHSGSVSGPSGMGHHPSTYQVEAVAQLQSAKCLLLFEGPPCLL